MTEIELHDQRTNYDLGHDLYILFNDLPDMDLTSVNSLSLRVVFFSIHWTLSVFAFKICQTFVVRCVHLLFSHPPV